MEELDAKVLEAIKNSPKINYAGYPLDSLVKRFVRPTKGVYEQELWAALSRLCKGGLVRKSGSHRYKCYYLVGEETPMESAYRKFGQ